MNMKWNVYYYDFNRKKIDTFNIFEHGSFRAYTKKAIKQHKKHKENIEDFAERLKRELQFYFWSKAEWELIIEITEDNRIFLIPWCGCRNPEEVKIEIKPVITEDGFDWLEFARVHIDRQKYGNKAKIDVYDQVMFEWDVFVNYVWNNKHEHSLYQSNQNTITWYHISQLTSITGVACFAD